MSALIKLTLGDLGQTADRGWTYLRADPRGVGLSLVGDCIADLEIAASSATVLLGQVWPSLEMVDEVGAPIAAIDTRRWINIWLRQFPANHTGMMNLSTIELHAMSAERPDDPKITKSPLMPMELACAFAVRCRYKLGKIGVDVYGSDQRLASIETGQFGACLPVMKLRHGKQPHSSGVLSAFASWRDA
jgi:hypothetical protein